MTSETTTTEKNSFAPQEAPVQPGDQTPHSSQPRLANVVLYQPQIPQNTGNIGRSCVATNSKLWIVQPAAFQIDEKRVRRAGLDYWQHLDWEDVPNWETLRERLPEQTPDRRYWYFSRFAERTIWDCDFKPGEVFVFGSETSGLPRTIFQPGDENAIRLPTAVEVRSLNLSSTVAIVLYETMRRKWLTSGISIRDAVVRFHHDKPG